MKSTPDSQLIEFLQQKLSISAEEIGVVMRRQNPTITQMPISLWQYGLITIQQLEKIFDWQESLSGNAAGI